MNSRLSLLFGLVLTAAAFAAKPKDFLDLGRYSDIKVSPDGLYLAAKIQGDDGRIRLLVRDLEKHKSAIVAPRDVTQGQWGEKSVNEFAWVNNEYIVVIGDWSDTAKSLHYVKAAGLRTDDPLPLLEEKGVNAIVDPIPGSSQFLISQNESSSRFSDCRVIRYDIENRQKSDEIYITQSKTFLALSDAQGRLRMVKKEESEGGPLAWFSRAPDSDSWKRLKLNPWLKVHGIAADSNLLFVSGSFGSLPAGLYYYDLAEDKVAQKLLVHDELPMDKIATPLFSNQNRLLVGAHIDGFSYQTQWANPSLSSIQKNVDAACQGSNNRIIAWDDAFNRIVVERIYSSQPHDFMAFNFKKAVMDGLFQNGPAVKGKEAASCIELSITNREGKLISGYFTKSAKTKGNAPLIVFIRNDPFGTIDRIEWKPADQYYASLGYAVLRLNFSGSGGLKGPLLALDWKNPEAAGRPARDLEDALKYISEKGWADTSRAALIGDGAGGWLATYATIASPGLYKCAVSNDAVYDLVEYQNKDVEGPISNVGPHPFADAIHGLSKEQLTAYSPMQNAAKISAPLFIAYGQWNSERYQDHAKQFAKVAKDAGVDVEKPYMSSGWGGNITSNPAFEEYHLKLTAFLKKHL